MITILFIGCFLIATGVGCIIGQELANAQFNKILKR